MITTNNIYQGDCYELIKQIPDKSIDLVYVDIPYLIGSQGGGFIKDRQVWKELKGNDKLSRLQEKEKELKAKMKNAKNKDEYEKAHTLHSSVLQQINYLGIDDGIDIKILDDYLRVLKKINMFIWCSKSQIMDIINYLSNKCSFEILVWCKRNCVPATNNVWLPNMEYCLYFREKGVRLNDGYELKSKWYISPQNKEDKNKYNHPTIKPLDLVERHIKHTTERGGVVLDTFMGSGTTCVACKNTGRQYIGFEINEQYFKIAQDRLNGITQTGQTFLFE